MNVAIIRLFLLLTFYESQIYFSKKKKNLSEQIRVMVILLLGNLIYIVKNK